MKKGGWKEASGLVRGRYEHHHNQFGLSDEDCARGEIGNTFAVLGNTLPCSWWMLWHIFTDARVLADIRREVSALVSEVPGEHACVIDMANVREQCPILLSTFQEVMRFRTVTTSVRRVLEDVMLDGKYLLKKGSTLMVPAVVQHSSEAAWGKDVAEFDHMRFVKKPGQKRSYNPSAFRGFGGGHTLCPGRHFASTEILALVAMMVLRFDIKPTSGTWVEPKSENTPLISGFPIPDVDIDIDVRPTDDREWRVSFSGTDKAMDMVHEEVAADD
jgi:cytochrome P450